MFQAKASEAFEVFVKHLKSSDPRILRRRCHADP
jgi:hypothetical protein